MSWIDLSTLIQNTAVAVAAVVTAGVAVIGLHAWRREILFRTNLDVFRRVVGAAVNLQASINASRHPVKLLPLPADGESEGSSYDKYYSRAWRSIDAARKELSQAKLEAKTLWGEQVSGSINDLNKIESEYWYEVHSFLEEGTSIRELGESDRERRKQVMRARIDHSDEFSRRIDEAVNAIRRSAGRCLHRKPSTR
ncbi:MAG: hypothetical protein AAF823_14165 [Planctomycetota bacterium]